MLNPIPSWAVKLQHPIEVSVEWYVMGLAVRSLELEDEEVIRKPNVPGVVYLSDECLVELCKCSAGNLVWPNSFSDGEDHVPKKPWVAIWRFLEGIVNHPGVAMCLNIVNRGKVVDNNENTAKHSTRAGRLR